jgi:hypothetical protein
VKGYRRNDSKESGDGRKFNLEIDLCDESTERKKRSSSSNSQTKISSNG